MAGVFGLEQRNNHHPSTAGEAMSRTPEPTADDFESVDGEQAAETRHLANVDRSASGPSQDRLEAPQDALKTAERGGSPRLAP